MILRSGDTVAIMAPRTLQSSALRPLTEIRGHVSRGSWNELTIELTFYDRDGLAQVISWPTKVRVADPITRKRAKKGAKRCTKKRK